MTAESARPDPDALLAQLAADAAAAQRGRLKIFFGAAPGVGKTYAMLSAARDAHANGVDVVVGLAETHGRAETEALLAGLEALPRRCLDYRERALAEFDLDAALARRPALLLVDELAHTNAPGSRHPKRWQDVEELLAAGIDVWTTLNVQHLESLNDVVGGITGVRVWETVADRVFDAADEVALVDLPPDDLLMRLKEGKVYLPAQAAMAADNFFRRPNLIALRDLALRRLAERVDTQVQTTRAAAPGTRVWATAESLLVCLGPGDTDGKLVRSAARLASKLDARWHAVYIETPRLQRLSEDRRSAILGVLRLAQEMGAETAVLAESDLVDAALDYARTHNLGKILIGRRARPQWRWWGKFMRRLGERAPDIDLLAVARRAEGPAAPRRVKVAPATRRSVWPRYVGAMALCVAVAVLVTPLRDTLELTNIAMLFLLAVVGAAFRWGRGPAVLAVVLSVALFDFFFVPPRLTFAVSDVQYLVTFAVMLVVGLTIGQSMAQLRYQARIAGHREQRIRNLYQMARDLAVALSDAQVTEIAERVLTATFRASVGTLLPDTHGKLTAPAQPGAPQVDMAIAQWCFDRGEPAGIGTHTLPAAAVAYLPLKAPAGVRGVLAVQPDNRRLLHIPEQRRLLETHATLIAMALERLHFATQVHETRLGVESERLRNSLLAALSHDLRTPLTALVGLADTLTLQLQAAHAPESETAAAIRDQALRTGYMVDNLLEMARLQSGTVTPRRDWLVLEEVIGAAARALEPALVDHPLRTGLSADLPLVRGDAVMLERVLVNLLDNAVKYTPPGTPIGINAAVLGDVLDVTVWDEGPGLPPGQEQMLFERFARGKSESAIAGVGLGLAICQAIVAAHGGHIRAENRPGGGARFVFTLPLAPPPAAPEETVPSTGPH